MNHNALSRSQDARKIVFMNLRYKHAVLTKLALIAGLLFISLWLWYLDGETLTTRDGMELPRQAIRIEESVACLPSRVASPTTLSKQKECFSMAELYSRLLWEDQKWFEPKDLGLNDSTGQN